MWEVSTRSGQNCTVKDYFNPILSHGNRLFVVKMSTPVIVEVDLLMDPTKDFPGIISPKVRLSLSNDKTLQLNYCQIETISKVEITQLTTSPKYQMPEDRAKVVSTPLKLPKHSNKPPQTKENQKSSEKPGSGRKVFAWRKVHITSISTYLDQAIVKMLYRFFMVLS